MKRETLQEFFDLVKAGPETGKNEWQKTERVKGRKTLQKLFPKKRMEKTNGRNTAKLFLKDFLIQTGTVVNNDEKIEPIRRYVELSDTSVD